MTGNQRKAVASVAFAVLCGGVAWLSLAMDWPIGDTARGVLAGFGAGGLFAALLLWWSP